MMELQQTSNKRDPFDEHYPFDDANTRRIFRRHFEVPLAPVWIPQYGNRPDRDTHREGSSLLQGAYSYLGRASDMSLLWVDDAYTQAPL